MSGRRVVDAKKAQANEERAKRKVTVRNRLSYLWMKINAPRLNRV